MDESVNHLDSTRNFGSLFNGLVFFRAMIVHCGNPFFLYVLTHGHTVII